MKPLSRGKMEELEGGINTCAASIALTAGIGSLFGGVGAVIGGALAATGPNCLGWW